MSEYNIQMNKYNALNAEYDQLYPQPMKHANTHAEDGNDPITPSMIGTYNKTEIDTALQKKPNQNFFDNPLFQVNQRGFSGENTSGGYFLDRFLGYNCSYTDGVLKIRKGMFDESVNGYIIQRVESTLSSELHGKVCTFSALVNDSLISGTAVYSNTSEVTYASKNGIRLYTQIANGLVELVAVTNETTEKAISAVKLELGSQQTIAHQDADGNWLLNEIPNYGEQLARCQRYFVRQLIYVNRNGEQPGYDVVHFPVEMSDVPSVVIENEPGYAISLFGSTTKDYFMVQNVSNILQNMTYSAIVPGLGG